MASMTTGHTTPIQLATQEVRTLWQGGQPSALPLESFAAWQDIIHHARTAYTQGGPSAARRALEVAQRTKGGAGLRALLIEPAPAITGSGMPPLPASAQAVYEHLAPCGAWLDEYVSFASQAAPMTPRSFHEAAALAGASAAIARRVFLHASNLKIFPNLYFLFLAPSTLWHKSTGMSVLTRVLDQARISDRKLPRSATPEALAQELSLNLPEKFWNWSQEMRDRWLQMRPFAAKRLWMLDEVSGFFDKARRDVYAELLIMLLNLYDCPDIEDGITTGRGLTRVQDSYVTFFGSGTPSGMAPHLTNRRLWNDGQWARFVFLMPTEKPSWQFFQEHLDLPSSIPAGLQRINDLFPTPRAELIDAGSEDAGRTTKIVQVYGGDFQSSCSLAPGVWEAWETYSKTIMYDLLEQGTVEPELHSCYGRMGTRLIKVAMLLATMDTEQLPVRIELRHLARAQQIMEFWRAMLHTVYANGIETDEENTTTKILALLAKVGARGLLIRDIYRPLHLNAKACRELLEELERSGIVEHQTTVITGGSRPADVWRLVVTTPDGDSSVTSHK